MNVGSSPYHSVGAIFCRGTHGDLLSIEGRDSKRIAEQWDTLQSSMRSRQPDFTTISPGIVVQTTQLETLLLKDLQNSGVSAFHTLTIREMFHQSKDCYVGIITCHLPSEDEETRIFSQWLDTFLLLETSLSPDPRTEHVRNEKSNQITEDVTVLFSTTLRNIASNDQWDTGVDLFRQRVLKFVARNKRIQMALPAFPCKSPNPRKVGSDGPDLAERIALQTLRDFGQSVKKIYPPGVTLWVISDGHVFSDCIGVDDETVSTYDQHLARVYQSMLGPNDDALTIRFQGLTDMFSPKANQHNRLPDEILQKLQIDHPISSRHSIEAENARKIMMAGFQSSREHFRQLIADQHQPTLNLYRGQARFMQDDLSSPDFTQKSAKQRKKISFEVATEMILRNQAYSNLLELLLPNYVRLSIHAHSNSGPKFGIRLFPRNKIHAIQSVSNRHELVPAFEFQVPTPWHNCIIKIQGDHMMYVGRADIVRVAIEKGEFEGGWVDDGLGGGHFELRPASDTSTSPSVSSTSSPASSVSFRDEKIPQKAVTMVDELVVVASQNEPQKPQSMRRSSRLVQVFSFMSCLLPRSTFISVKSKGKVHKKDMAVC